MWKAQWIKSTDQLPTTGIPGLLFYCKNIGIYGDGLNHVELEGPYWWAHLPTAPTEDPGIWYDASKCAPLFSNVITYRPDQYYIQSYSYYFSQIDWHGAPPEVKRPTHWMNLPEWPEEVLNEIKEQAEEGKRKYEESANAHAPFRCNECKEFDITWCNANTRIDGLTVREWNKKYGFNSREKVNESRNTDQAE